MRSNEDYKDRFCLCGNPRPMLLKNGRNGAFYSCDIPTCSLTQSPGSEVPKHIGSVKTPTAPISPAVAERLRKQDLHSQTQGYLQRKAWHERHNMPFLEPAPHVYCVCSACQ